MVEVLTEKDVQTVVLSIEPPTLKEAVDLGVPYRKLWNEKKLRQSIQIEKLRRVAQDYHKRLNNDLIEHRVGDCACEKQGECDVARLTIKRLKLDFEHSFGILLPKESSVLQGDSKQ